MLVNKEKKFLTGYEKCALITCQNLLKRKPKK